MIGVGFGNSIAVVRPLRPQGIGPYSLAYVALPDQELAFVIQIPPLAIFLRLISEGADVPFEEVVPVMMPGFD